MWACVGAHAYAMRVYVGVAPYRMSDRARDRHANSCKGQEGRQKQRWISKVGLIEPPLPLSVHYVIFRVRVKPRLSGQFKDNR